MKAPIPRNVKITKGDLETYGYTARCLGCVAVLRGAAPQGHSVPCRKRLEEEMKDLPKTLNAKRKSDDFVAEALEKEDADRRKAVKKENEGEHKSGKAHGPGLSSMGAERKRDAEDAQLDVTVSVREPNENQRQDEAQRRKVAAPGQDSSSIPIPTGAKREREDLGDDDEEPLRKVMVGVLEVNQEDEEDWQAATRDIFYDDRTGKTLDADLVDTAEKEELAFMERIGVGEVCDARECWEKTGRAPVTTKFVRVDKGSDSSPDVRVRLCARDFKPKGEQTRCDLFAAMPPLEAKKLLFRQAARSRKTWRSGRWRSKKLLFIDAKKAHLNGVVPPDVYAYVVLPSGICWRLRRWLYGMRPAAHAWEADYAAKLESIGFRRGKSAPTVFFNAQSGCRCVVHGDDFTFLGFDIELHEIIRKMREWYELKVRGVLGNEDGDDKEVTILNRRLSWRNGVIEYEADDKHVKVIAEELQLEMGSKGLEAPIEKDTIEEGNASAPEDDLLSGSGAKKFRGLAARSNYLAQDRTDIQYAVKKICRHTSKPRARHWSKLKRLGRYLIMYPRVVWRFVDDSHRGTMDRDHIDVFTDSDWAGDKTSRRSTSGGMAVLAGGVVKSWSSTQGTVAMSVGEAEYYALVKGAAEGLAIQALAEDLGWTLKLRLWVDSNTAKAVVARIGLGRIRHMEVKYLWAQEAHKNGRFVVRKVAGDRNPADVLTKPLSATELKPKLESVGAVVQRRSDTQQALSRAGRPKWCDMEESEDDDEVDESPECL